MWSTLPGNAKVGHKHTAGPTILVLWSLTHKQENQQFLATRNMAVVSHLSTGLIWPQLLS
jgi:hypothetical protein